MEMGDNAQFAPNHPLKDSTKGDCALPLPPLFSVSLVRLANIRNLHC